MVIGGFLVGHIVSGHQIGHLLVLTDDVGMHVGSEGIRYDVTARVKSDDRVFPDIEFDSKEYSLEFIVDNDGDFTETLA